MTKTRRADRPDTAAPIDKRIGVIAGGGRLPVDLVQGLRARGETPFVILIGGEVEDPGAFEGVPHAIIELEGAGRVIPLLKKEGVTTVVLAGTVARRPKAMRFRPILPLLPVLAKLVPALARGDDNLLRVVVDHMESQGIKVAGAHELMPDLLVPAGVHTRRRPRRADKMDIEAAFAAAKAIGALDIGQAAVSVGGRAIALEGIEGTDGLLERVAGLRDHGRLSGRKGGVLVKCPKPGQEVRADLPAIGVHTVEGAHAAGLNGIAVEADTSLALGFKELIEKADELGLFVVGLPAEQSK